MTYRWVGLAAALAASVLIYRDAGEIGALLFVAQKVSEPSAPHPAREVAPSPAVAPVLDETPRDFVAHVHAEFEGKVLAGEPIDELVTRMRPIVDADAATRATFGPDFYALSEAQQEQATTLVGSLLALRALRQIREARGAKWVLGGTRIEGSETFVSATIRSADREPISVEYVLRSSSRRWQLVDIQTEGVSLRRGYGRQIHRLMTDPGGPEGVLARLRKKAASEAVKAS